MKSVKGDCTDVFAVDSYKADTRLCGNISNNTGTAVYIDGHSIDRLESLKARKQKSRIGRNLIDGEGAEGRQGLFCQIGSRVSFLCERRALRMRAEYLSSLTKK